MYMNNIESVTMGPPCVEPETPRPNRAIIRAALNREGARLKSAGFSKHSAIGLNRRIARRKNRRWMLNRTFSRTIEAQLRSVT